MEKIQISVIYNISKALTSYTDIHKNLEYIVNILNSYLGYDRVFINLENPLTQELETFGSIDLSYKKGEGITGLTYQLGIPLYATEDELLNKTGLLKRLCGKDIAFFTAPIKVGDKTIGVLGLFKDVSTSPVRVEKILETLSVVGSILGTYLGLKEKSELPPVVAWEMMKNLDSGRLEGEFLFATENQRMKEILLLLDRLKNLNTPVLFTGDSGVGKATYARLLHEISPRKKKSFEVVDTRGLTAEKLEELLEEKIKAAEGGTLLIRRIEFLPSHLQEKIFEVAKSGSVRILATAGRKLEEVFSQGKFLFNLYDLLKTFEIHIPSLEERREDIEPLFRFIFSKYKTALGVDVKITPEAVRFISEKPPRDNIRGLDRLAKKLLTIFADKDLITLRDLELVEPSLKEGVGVVAVPKKDKKTFTEQLIEEEKRKIIEALERTNYVKSRAAKMLGYTLRQLDYRLKKYGIEIRKQNQ